MRSAIWPAAATALMLTGPAHAERPDCSLFPDMHSRFACYDNVSRAPSPEPADAAKPALPGAMQILDTPALGVTENDSAHILLGLNRMRREQ